ETSDVTLRYRADVTLVNSLALAAHYDEAYARLSKLVEVQPTVPRKEDRVIGYGVAAVLYNDAGQYDFAIVQAEHWMSEDPGDTATCKAGTQKLDSVYRSGRLKTDEPFVGAAIDSCARIGDAVFADIVRTLVANVFVNEGRSGDAIKLLKGHEPEILQTRSAGDIAAL